MHAAVHDQRIKASAFIESPVSWESLLAHRLYDQHLGATIVPSALKYYDLGDLLGLLAPRGVLVLDPVDGDGRPAPEIVRKKLAEVVKLYYGEKMDRFLIEKSAEENQLEDTLIRWLEKRK